MPLWGIFVVGAGALLAGWLLGTDSAETASIEDELVKTAKIWDSMSLDRQNAVANTMVSSGLKSGNKSEMARLAAFLDGMDRPDDAALLRAEAVRI